MSRRESVSAEHFVKAYLDAHRAGLTIGQLAESLEMEKASANVKASQLRNQGIKLPKLRQVRKSKDLGALAKMVSDYEASLIDLDGKENVTISDHMDPEVQDEDPQYEGNDGRTLVGSM